MRPDGSFTTTNAYLKHAGSLLVVAWELPFFALVGCTVGFVRRVGAVILSVTLPAGWHTLVVGASELLSRAAGGHLGAVHLVRAVLAVVLKVATPLGADALAVVAPEQFCIDNENIKQWYIWQNYVPLKKE